MKIKILFLSIGTFLISGLHAQQFISKAVIEYEMKANIKKTMGNGDVRGNAKRKSAAI